MYKRHHVIFVVAVFMSGLVTVGCGDQQSNMSGDVTNFSGCKAFSSGGQGAPAAVDVPPSRACVTYDYDGEGILLLKHINGGFNCCPGEISADIVLDGKTITITEREAEAGCKCNCLFDVDVKIRNVKPGTYTVNIIEPYLSGPNDPLMFSVDLSSAKEGSYCVDRAGYPWPE